MSDNSLKPAPEPMSSPRLWVSFGVYIALLMTLGVRHEMWRDEVRALSVATQAASWGNLISELHREGHPLLWYAVLRLGFAATHSNLVLPIAGILFAAAGAFLILRFAPFPFVLRLLTVFGAFLGYELSVVPRNYGIGVLFMILAAIAFGRRDERPVFLGLLIALMANTSVHAAMAGVVLLFYWAADLFNDARRRSLMTGSGVAGVAIGIAGIVAALLMARPSSNMAWATTVNHFDVLRAMRSVLSDPGHALRGVEGASVAAAGELPWRLVGIDRDIASRIVVDVCIGFLLWQLRRHRTALASALAAVLGFGLLFRSVYSGSPRHEAILFFLLVCIAWIAVGDDRMDGRRAKVGRPWLGLMPLAVIQSLALLIVAQRTIRRPESASRAFGEFVSNNPRYANAIVASEPDYMAESIRYYLPNRIFMPRQREITDRVFFDGTGRRQLRLSLGTLMQMADSVSCANNQPVLLAIGHSDVWRKESGSAQLAYKGTVFQWNSAERDSLKKNGKEVFALLQTTTDEAYTVFEMDPPSVECTAAPGLRTR